MSTIHVEHKHILTGEEAIEKAKQLVKDFGDRLSADVAWNGPSATFKGKGFSGTALIESGKIVIRAELGFFVSALKGKIESKLLAELSEKFPTKIA